MWAERPVKNWSDATGGEGSERNFWQEIKNKNWVELERHIAGNYVCVTASGSRNRADSIERLKQLQLDEYSLGEFQVELNAHTLVVAYIVTMKGSFNGQPLPANPVRVMGVWHQHKSGWMAIAHSASGLDLK